MSDAHTHCGLDLKALWVTVEAVILAIVEETVGRGLDVLIFMLLFYLR